MTIARKLEHVDIELTRQCNLKCIHCSAGRNVVGKELSVENIRRILQEAKSLGLEKVGFTGGEPFLRKSKLLELSEFCKNEIGALTHLHTNGTMISYEDAQNIKPLIDEVTITLYGSTVETHDSITQIDGSMNSTLNGFGALMQAGVTTSSYIVPMKRNLHDIIPLIRMMCERGCKKFRVLSVSPTGRALQNYSRLTLDDDEEAWLNGELVKAQREINAELYAGYCTKHFHPGLKMLPGHYSCLAAENRIHIDAFGNVYPCTAASGRIIFSAGNLQMPGYALSEIWQHSPMLQFIRRFHADPPIKCRGCSLYKDCTSGCRVIISHKYGDVTLADPECKGQVK